MFLVLHPGAWAALGVLSKRRQGLREYQDSYSSRPLPPAFQPLGLCSSLLCQCSRAGGSPQRQRGGLVVCICLEANWVWVLTPPPTGWGWTLDSHPLVDLDGGGGVWSERGAPGEVVRIRVLYEAVPARDTGIYPLKPRCLGVVFLRALQASGRLSPGLPWELSGTALACGQLPPDNSGVNCLFGLWHLPSCIYCHSSSCMCVVFPSD